MKSFGTSVINNVRNLKNLRRGKDRKGKGGVSIFRVTRPYF